MTMLPGAEPLLPDVRLSTTGALPSVGNHSPSRRRFYAARGEVFSLNVVWDNS